MDTFNCLEKMIANVADHFPVDTGVNTVGNVEMLASVVSIFKKVWIYNRRVMMESVQHKVGVASLFSNSFLRIWDSL